jgi:hypothetical protein
MSAEEAIDRSGSLGRSGRRRDRIIRFIRGDSPARKIARSASLFFASKANGHVARDTMRRFTVKT